MKNTMFGLTVVMVLAVGAGCSEPLVGDWKGGGDGAARENEMSIFDDGKGDGTIYFYSPDPEDTSLYKADFDIQWTALDDGRYDLEFECQGNCSDWDFTMDCMMFEDEKTMRCDGDGVWSDYDFEWAYAGE